jgi:membrane protease YdiL (CAAX protease family)
MTTEHETPSKSDNQTDKPAFPFSPLASIAIVVGVYFASMISSQLVIGLYPMLAGWSSERTDSWVANSAAAQFLYVLVAEALTIGLLYLFVRRRKVSAGSIGLLRPRLRNFGITLLAYPPYFVLNAVAAVIAQALLHVNTSQQQQTGFESAHSTTDLILTFISLVVLPPIVEEIVMRGFLFSGLKQGMSVVKAAFLTSVIFATAHLQFGNGAPLLWVAAIDTFILSLVLCYLRQRTGSLWSGIGLHALKNALAFTVIFILPRVHFSLF